jgi:cysteine desulfurase / selenocysteine lyase
MTTTAAQKSKDANPALGLDIEKVRADFPAMSLEVHGKPLVFLDSGASAQKPRAVIDTMRRVYESEYANVHRGAYYLSERATALYEGARDTLRDFLNAGDRKEIIFTRNATESINLVAHAWGRSTLKPGDEIIISEMEHHSNIVPWQMLRDEKDLVLKIAPISDDGEFLMEAFKALLTDRTKLVAITHTSNVLGTITPAKEIARLAHDAGAKVLFDGAQAAVHMPVDVQDIDCDFYAITGHKLYGPSGIGVLYGKEELLDAMPPFMGGGDMISSVSFEKSTWAPLPAKFEAGTPAIVQAIGFAAAVDYVTDIGFDAIAAHEHDLLNYTTQKLASVEDLRLIGTAPNKAAVVSFELGKIHAHDVSTIIDRAGVAIRAGHHCAEPLMDRMGVAATARASFGLYNTRQDADTLVEALETVQEIFG